jgi:hypothetical protein
MSYDVLIFEPIIGNTAVTYTRPYVGRVVSVYADYTSANANTDVVLASIGNTAGIAPRTILTITNANSDVWVNPSVPLHDNAAAAVTYDGTNEIYVPTPFFGYLKVTTTDNDSDKSVQVFVIIET